MNNAVARRYRADGMASTPPGRLLVMLYDRLQIDLERAEEAIAGGSVEAAHRALVHAQEIVFELKLALDVTVWPEGQALDDIYEYLLRQLVVANTTKSAAVVHECQGIVAPLAESWHDALRLSAPAVSIGSGVSA